MCFFPIERINEAAGARPTRLRLERVLCHHYLLAYLAAEHHAILPPPIQIDHYPSPYRKTIGFYNDFTKRKFRKTLERPSPPFPTVDTSEPFLRDRKLLLRF